MLGFVEKKINLQQVSSEKKKPEKVPPVKRTPIYTNYMVSTLILVV